MRKIFVTDVNSKADVCQDSNINCPFTLPLRFTRGGKKRKLHNQRDLKPLKLNMALLGLDLNKVSKGTVRTCDSAVAPSCSFRSDLYKVSKVTVRTCDNAVVPSCSFRMKPDRSVKDIRRGLKGCPRFQSPEEDAYVFNPVRQFKGNTYTRKKNSGVR
jgi:hypothetical protein